MEAAVGSRIRSCDCHRDDLGAAAIVGRRASHRQSADGRVVARELVLPDELNGEPDTQCAKDQREHHVRTACPSLLPSLILDLPFTPAGGVGVLCRHE